jgi:glycosyltransferase involved in cell wall biosynthesis
MSNSWSHLFHGESGSPEITRHFRVIRRSGNPLLYLPTGGLASSRAVQIYAAQTPIARAAQTALRIALRYRLPLPLQKETVALPANSPLSQFFAQVSAGKDWPEFSVLCGNPKSSGQRHIFVLLDADERPSIVIKAGQNPRARQLIASEARFLQSLPANTAAVPPLCGSIDTAQVTAFATEFRQGDSPRSGDTAEMARILTAWIHPAADMPLQDIPAWQRLRLTPHPFLPRMPGAQLKQSIKPVLFHGDFAPWNIRSWDGRWTVLDWERGETQGVPGWDWFHYVIQTSILVKKDSPQRTFERLRELVSSPPFTRYSQATGLDDRVGLVLAGYLVHARNLRQTEGAEQIEALLHGLDRYWPSWTGERDEPVVVAGAPRPDFSIITPSYGQLDWLRLCLASVQDQTDGSPPSIRIEHLVEDGGSAGIDTVAEYAGNFPSNGPSGYALQVNSANDRGMYDAINRGFLRARGEIVAWLNSDEQYLPGSLQKVSDFFAAHPDVDVVFGDALLADRNGSILSYRRAVLPERLHTQLAHLNTLSCAMFFRRRLIERGFLLDENSKAVADAKWVAALLDAKIPMAVLPEPLSVFVMTQANLGQTSLARLESIQWRKDGGVLRGLMRAPAIVFHRLRKFLAGAYLPRSVRTSFYRLGYPEQRVSSGTDRASHEWPGEHEADEAESSSSKRRKTRLILGGVLFPLLYSVAAQWIDHLIAGITLTPFLSIVCLLSMAFFSPPVVVAMAAVIFSGSALLSFLDFANLLRQEEPGRIFVLIRFASFIAASAGAVLLSIYRQRAARARTLNNAILTNMAVPLVTSDALGLITFANTQALAILKESAGSIIGQKWIRFMMNQTDEGTATKLYLKLFEDDLSPQNSVTLHLASQPHQATQGTLVCIGDDRDRVLLTTWNADEGA